MKKIAQKIKGAPYLAPVMEKKLPEVAGIGFVPVQKVVGLVYDKIRELQNSDVEFDTIEVLKEIKDTVKSWDTTPQKEVRPAKKGIPPASADKPTPSPATPPADKPPVPRRKKR